MTLKFPRSRRFETTAFHPRNGAVSTLRWLKPIIPTIHVYQICFISISHVRYTHTHIFFHFLPLSILSISNRDTWFLSMKMGIAMERKEKRVQNTKKSKRREKRRWIDLRFKLLEEFFSKLYPANPLCTCSVLDRDYNHHR